MERRLDTIIKRVQEGMSTAVDRAGDLTRLGRVRLDIAAIKNRMTRAQARLGAQVYRRLQAEGVDQVTAAEVDDLFQRIAVLEAELRQREDDLASLEDQVDEKRRPAQGTGGE
ncbi:MAG: hypothetical protein GKR89_04390 [Candidatus Latescibacteria bacterium]|nr:hypothetical protein [Candidatus Latescibacterota bacterium]